MRHLIVGRDPEVPGKYLLVVLARAPVGNVDVTDENVLTWKEGRRVLSPEEYHFVCAAAFGDWCRRNGWAA